MQDIINDLHILHIMKKLVLDTTFRMQTLL